LIVVDGISLRLSYSKLYKQTQIDIKTDHITIRLKILILESMKLC